MIFEDRTGTRRRWALSACILLVLLGAVPVGAFLIGVWQPPNFPGRFARAQSGDVAPAPAPAPAPAAEVSRAERRVSNVVFVAHDDPPGARAVDEHLAQIDVLVPDWFRLPGAGCEVKETVDDASRGWAARKDVRVVARLANLSGDRKSVV